MEQKTTDDKIAQSFKNIKKDMDVLQKKQDKEQKELLKKFDKQFKENFTKVKKDMNSMEKDVDAFMDDVRNEFEIFRSLLAKEQSEKLKKLTADLINKEVFDQLKKDLKDVRLKYTEKTDFKSEVQAVQNDVTKGLTELNEYVNKEMKQARKQMKEMVKEVQGVAEMEEELKELREIKKKLAPLLEKNHEKERKSLTKEFESLKKQLEGVESQVTELMHVKEALSKDDIKKEFENMTTKKEFNKQVTILGTKINNVKEDLEELESKRAFSGAKYQNTAAE